MRILPFVLALILQFNGKQASSQQEYTKVLMAAKSEYLSYLKKIPDGKETLYGFTTRTEFTKIVIEKPYQIVTLVSDFYQNPNLSLENSIDFTNEWLVPLSVDGAFRALLTVSKVNNNYKVVAIGDASLAYELGEMRALHNTSKDYYTLLRIFQFKSDFLMQPSSDKTEKYTVYPLSSGIVWLQQSYKGFNVEQILDYARKSNFE